MPDDRASLVPPESRGDNHHLKMTRCSKSTHLQAIVNSGYLMAMEEDGTHARSHSVM